MMVSFSTTDKRRLESSNLSDLQAWYTDKSLSNVSESLMIKIFKVKQGAKKGDKMTFQAIIFHQDWHFGYQVPSFRKNNNKYCK